jgi:hypothetical protein
MPDDSRAMRDKWKMVDGDCRDSNEGLITYHVNAFDEGAQAARASSEAEIARLKENLFVYSSHINDCPARHYANNAPCTCGLDEILNTGDKNAKMSKT